MREANRSLLADPHAELIQCKHRGIAQVFGAPELVTEFLSERLGKSIAQLDNQIPGFACAEHEIGSNGPRRPVGRVDELTTLRSAFSSQAAMFRRTAVFRAHFGQGRKACTPRRYRSQVENDQCEAQQIGAHGTPFLVIDERDTVPGAICTDDLRRPDQSRPDQPVLRDARKRWSRMGCGPYRGGYGRGLPLAS